ncbi:MAG: aromatic ring-hydroxylating dioxygenase subunit alpha, partial [Alphaproteobacteria bacterium]|nr:aromatic ring-hydroxylating dioxygenase subunit alpha [Alphaproteobacteria bacterium]
IARALFKPTELAIEPIGQAVTIPARWYTDPAVFEVEADRVFGRTWQIAGRADQVAVPGAYFTCTVGREPLVVARGQDGQIRAFSNVCRHRGGPVARGEGVLPVLHCAYHGWTYNLDGSLRHARELGPVENFDPRAACLPPAQVTVVGPFVLVNLGREASPVDRFLGDFPEALARIDVAKLRFVTQKTYEVACNWKILLDNFLECYHCPLLHRDTVAAKVDLDGYVVESHDWYSRHYFASAPPASLATARSAAKAERTGRAIYCFFPNFAVNLLPGWLITFRVLPLAIDRSLVAREFFCDAADKPTAELERDGPMAYYAKVFAEDMDMVRQVQIQLRSTLYTSGRYSVKHEQGIYHFHAMLRRALADKGTRRRRGK